MDSVSHGSTDVLEHILSHEDCDVDPINRIEKATPLHIAVRIEDPELRRHITESLLEAGADTSCVFFDLLYRANSDLVGNMQNKRQEWGYRVRPDSFRRY